MDEPSASVHIEGSTEWVSGEAFPTQEVEHRPLYLRPRGGLSPQPEPLSKCR